MDDNGNGHISIDDPEMPVAFKGALLELNKIQEEDGRLAQATRNSNKQNQGVINRILSSTNNEEYREILLRIKNPKLVNYFLDALAECRKYKLDDQITYIVDRMHAEAANSVSDLIIKGFQALTHTTITSNVNAFGRAKNWFKRGNNNNDNGTGAAAGPAEF